MVPPLNLVGKRYGKLVIQKRAGTKSGRSTWECLCDCGNTKELPGARLNRQIKEGKTPSCGCAKQEGMIKNKDYVGQKFGNLTVTKYVGPSKSATGTDWLCDCSCGGKTEVNIYRLLNGNTTSCGCKVRAHGLSGTLTHKRWRSMRGRCIHSKNNPSTYRDYQGRGIIFQPSWEYYENFLKDMGECPEGYSLERKDPNGNYTKENCEWIPINHQGWNKRNSIRLTLDGETKSIGEWSHITGINTGTLYSRYAKGYSSETILNTPVGAQRNKINGRIIPLGNSASVR